MKIKILLFASLILLQAACSIAPFSSSITARSNGNGVHSFQGGGTLVGAKGVKGVLPEFKWLAGLTDNWDIGLQYEILSLGLLTRYSFVNNDEGFSLAGFGGFGDMVGGNYIYAGPAVSFRAGQWEPFFNLRYNHIHWKKQSGTLNFTSNDGTSTGIPYETSAVDFHYYQAALGTVFWFTEKFGLNLDANAISSNSGKVFYYAGINLQYRGSKK